MIKVTQSELSGAIAVINGFAKSPSGSSSNPALKYVTLQTSSDGKFLVMSAWDSIKGARWKIPLSGGNELPLSAIAASDLRDFVVRLPEGGELELTIVTTGLQARMGKSRQVFPCLLGESLSLMPSLDSEAIAAKISPSELSSAAENCFCFSDVSGDILEGVLLKWDKTLGEFSGLSSDRGHVTALYTCECDVLVDMSVILPGESLKAIASALKKQVKASEIEVRSNNGAIQFDIYSSVVEGELLATFYSRVLAGEFPAVKKLRDNALKTVTQDIMVSRLGLIERLERVLLVAKKSNDLAEFHFNQEQLVIKTPPSDHGDAEEEIGISNANQLSTMFNAKYVLTTLRAIASEDVIIGVGTETSPAFFRPTSGVKCEYLIMPRHVPNS